MKPVKVKFTSECRQSKPNKKAPNNPDIPRKNYNPKELMDELPKKKKL